MTKPKSKPVKISTRNYNRLAKLADKKCTTLINQLDQILNKEFKARLRRKSPRA